MLWLVRAKNEIINRLPSLIATNEFIRIESFSNRVLGERRTCHEGIRFFGCQSVDLKLHVVAVGIVIIERQSQAVPYWPRGQHATALQTLVRIDKLAEVIP